MNLNGTEYFYIRNIQGDIVKIVDENANLMVEYYYDAWGNILYTEDNIKYKSISIPIFIILIQDIIIQKWEDLSMWMD